MNSKTYFQKKRLSEDRLHNALETLYGWAIRERLIANPEANYRLLTINTAIAAVEKCLEEIEKDKEKC